MSKRPSWSRQRINMLIFAALLISLAAGIAAFASGAEANLVGSLLRYVLLVSNAVMLGLTGLFHLLKPEVMARKVGWTAGGPFQTIVGFWNIGAALLCGIAFFGSTESRILAAVPTALFWAGASSVNWRAFRSGNRARGSTAAAELLTAALLAGLAAASAGLIG